jgi:hypothetical protein
MQGPAVSGTPAKSSVPVERTVYVWGIAIVAALGGLLFGYDWVVIGGARQFYEIYFHLSSPGLVGWANSCALARSLLDTLPTAMGAAEFFWSQPFCLQSLPCLLDGRTHLRASSCGASWAAPPLDSVPTCLRFTLRKSALHRFAGVS